MATWRVWRSIALLATVAMVLITVGLLARPAWASATSAQSPTDLSAAAVLDAFVSAGLPVTNVRQQPLLRGGPSGPPGGEREAWAFALGGDAPGGGRILVFADDRLLQQKAAWFRKSGSGGAIVTHRNILLWLDPALDPREVARYRQALQGVR